MDMEEMLMFRLMGGGLFGSAIDLTALLAFLTIAVLYMIAPPLGYQEDRRGGLLTALYLLFFYGALSLVQVLTQWGMMLDGNLGQGLFGRPGPGGGAGIHLVMVFSMLKLVLFLAAMLVLIGGLKSLRLGSYGDLRNRPRGELTADDFRRRDD